MSSYKINFDQLRQQPEIAEMLSSLERGLQKFGIDFYLVGAVARDIWMSGIHKIAPRRVTRDIDFAVLINDHGTYEALKNYLIASEGFHPYKGDSFVLIWKDKTQVDLLPFGEMKDEDGKLTTGGLGLTSISLQGFSEIYEDVLPEIELESKHRFKICTLQGIVLLKMIAWDDRPEARKDDIDDICDILNHFFDMCDNEIYEHHSDLFGDEYKDRLHTAARVLGRQMKQIANRNEHLFSRIDRIFNDSLVAGEKSKMAILMSGYFENTVEENIGLLQQIKQGFSENNEV